MILKDGIKKALLVFVLATVNFTLQAQVTSGKIVFERKTNLKKRMGDNPMAKKMITDQNKYRIEKFELTFNDSICVFKPLADDQQVEGFLKFLTTKNTVYQNIHTRKKQVVMDLWGTEAIVVDTMDIKAWKITDSKRAIGGYMCRKAIYQANDSTKIYAWYAPDLVPAVGPEGFDGLPGTILGLASEDGSVIYFAKEVKILKPETQTMLFEPRGKQVYTEKELMEVLLKRVGQWLKPKDLEAMFLWI